MKFKLIAAILGLGSMIALPGALVAQNSVQTPDDQMQDQMSKPSPNIQMQAPNDQAPNYQGSMSQDSINQDSINQDQDSLNQSSAQTGSNSAGFDSNYSGANGSNANDPSYNTPAPEETNGVARVSLIHGDVSTQRGDNGEWSAAALNAPVLAGDRVSTGDKARTELQLDYANMLRLAEHSQANINTLTKSQIQVQLGHGMANYSVYGNSDADAEIDTPNVAIRTGKRESSFRILVTADDHTEVLVRTGEIEITTPQGGTRVTQGQFITIQGSGADEQYKIGEAPARDDWDQWNTDRDNVIRNASSRQKTNNYYVGSEDLDGHGTWSEVPDYGQVWRPAVSDPDWAPYRDGRWVNEPYWGWTWVSSDSWGWAPYHYGRWMYLDGGWGWWPGPAYGYPDYRPIWAPAYVSFYGFGGGFGGGFGFGFGGGWGSIGWLPLGPCDHFHPWYGRYGGRFGDRDFRSFNRGGFSPLHGGNRFSNVNLAINDRHFRGGTTVSGRDFGTGHMRPQATNQAQFRNARFSSGRLPVNPSRESFSASGRPAAASTIRNAPQNQHFFSARGTGNTTNGSRSFAGNGSHELGRPVNGNSNLNSNNNSGRGFNNGVTNGGNNGSNNGARNSSNNGFRRSNESGQNNGFGSRAGSVTNNSQARPERGNWNSDPVGRSSNSGSTTSGRENHDNGGGWQRFSQMPSHSQSEPSRSGNGGSSPALGRPVPAGSENRGTYGDRGANGSPYGSGRSSASEGRGYSSPSYNSPSHNSPSYSSPSHSSPSHNSPSYGSPGYGSPSYGSPSYSSPSRGGYGSDGRGYSGSSRPTLNMRQPIVTQRSYGGGSYGGSSYGGGYSGNRGGYSGGGRPSPAPSYGGGGRSAPSYSGGGRPSSGGGGGHSAPSGGSSRGGGGSSHSGGGGGRHGR